MTTEASLSSPVSRALTELFQRIRAELDNEQADRLTEAIHQIPDD